MAAVPSGYPSTMAPTAGTDLTFAAHGQRPGALRTLGTLILLTALLVGSWVLTIGAVVLLYRLFT